MKLKLALFILLTFVLISPRNIYAADFQVKGEVVDAQNSHVAGATITYKASYGNKTISGVTNQNGTYSIIVPEGTYNVVVDPPTGISVPQVVTSGKIVSGDTRQDYTLATQNQKVDDNQVKLKTDGLHPSLVYIVFGVLLFIVCLFVYIFLLRNRKNKRSKNLEVPLTKE